MLRFRLVSLKISLLILISQHGLQLRMRSLHGYYVYHIQNSILKKDSNTPICSAANDANEGTRTVDILTALVCSAFLAGTAALILEIALKRPETFREMLPGARVFAEAPVEARSVTGTDDRGSGRGVLATA